jgi:hypothetical protein
MASSKNEESEESVHLPVAIFYSTFKTDDKATLACELVC